MTRVACRLRQLKNVNWTAMSNQVRTWAACVDDHGHICATNDQEAMHYLYAAATINKLAAKLYINVYDSGFKSN